MSTVVPDVVDVPVYRPHLDDHTIAAATGALRDGWLGMGPLTAEFERRIGQRLDVGPRPVVAVNSGTAALHCALLAAEIGPGDEVICPSFTYVAGHQAVTATGAEVVFADIEADTLALDAAAVEALVTPRTKAIMLVHYAGIPARDWTDIHLLAHRHGLRVIEDAAHAFGSKVAGRPIGSVGDLICFSFGPVKVMTSLEGGAVVGPTSASRQLLEEVRLIGVDSDTASRYAKGRNWEYDVRRQGYRYHLGSIPAAIGLSQLELVDEFIANRQRYCRRYNQALGQIDGLTVPGTDFADVSPYIYFVRVDDPEQRADLIAHLGARGVGTGIHYPGAHDFTFYKDARRGDLAMTEQAASTQVTLPLHSYMADATVDQVIEAVDSFFS